MRMLTDEEKAQRAAIPDEDYGFAEAPSDDHDSTCSECGGTLRMIDPAQVANLNRPYFIEMRRGYGIDAVMDGFAWMCLTCDATILEPDVPLDE